VNCCVSPLATDGLGGPTAMELKVATLKAKFASEERSPGVRNAAAWPAKPPVVTSALASPTAPARLWARIVK